MIVKDNDGLQVDSRPPKVSIGLPVYNGERFITEALDTLLLQTFTDFELIISDNASTDGTEAICRDYAARDPRIQYIRQPVNRGATANFRFVLDASSGEYFMWAAADDQQRSDFIESLVLVLDQNPTFAGAMTDVENRDEAGNLLFISKLDDIRIDAVESNWKNVKLRFFRNPTSNVFFAIYGLFRRNILSDVEMNYKNILKHSSSIEIPFMAQVSLRGKIASIELPLKIYIRHKDSEYHREITTINKKQKFIHFLNVSRALILIAYDCTKIDPISRLKYVITVLQSFFKKIITDLIPHRILKFYFKYRNRI
jgi:glycosyltransferase involved in cell wall biosynthesis